MFGRFPSVLALLLATLLAGCQALTGETLGENIDDATLTAYVKTKLVAEKAVNLTRVDVDTTRGVVHLNGVVQSEGERARAEQLAREVRGVRDVVNNLQVQRR
ncbi:MAG TPA: BON domain-containing protein [Candidatus Acidoferrales bacterium]|nr:BON domain-containing protein [Candidatus Acidoferrales bacterium]